MKKKFVNDKYYIQNFRWIKLVKKMGFKIAQTQGRKSIFDVQGQKTELKFQSHRFRPLETCFLALKVL